MTMLMAVVREDGFAEHPGVGDGAEAGGERRAVLERFELRLGVGVSLDTCGREWDRLMPKKLSNSAT